MRLVDADKLKVSYDGHFVGVAKNDLDNAPTVEAEPVRHGHWQHINPLVDTIECSVCGYELPSEELATPHCAWCGAKMDEGKVAKNRDRLKTMSDDEWYQFLTGKELEILKFKGTSFIIHLWHGLMKKLSR